MFAESRRAEHQLGKAFAETVCDPGGEFARGEGTQEKNEGHVLRTDCT